LKKNPKLYKVGKMSIYILKLQGGNYWVGHTSYKIKGIHQFNHSSAWIIMHEPLSIYKIFGGKKNLVDKEVKDLMITEGIQHVRGGSYSSPVLNDSVIYDLREELFGNADKTCFLCGCKGHFLQDCPDDDSDDSGDTISEFFDSTEPSPALMPRPAAPLNLPPAFELELSAIESEEDSE
jgi:hypothetical protein